MILNNAQKQYIYETILEEVELWEDEVVENYGLDYYHHTKNTLKEQIISSKTFEEAVSVIEAILILIDKTPPNFDNERLKELGKVKDKVLSYKPIFLNYFDKEELAKLFPKEIRIKVKKAETLAEVRFIAWKNEIKLDENDVEKAFRESIYKEDAYNEQYREEIEEFNEWQEEQEWKDKLNWLKNKEFNENYFEVDDKDKQLI